MLTLRRSMEMVRGLLHEAPYALCVCVCVCVCVCMCVCVQVLPAPTCRFPLPPPWGQLARNVLACIHGKSLNTSNVQNDSTINLTPPLRFFHPPSWWYSASFPLRGDEFQTSLALEYGAKLSCSSMISWHWTMHSCLPHSSLIIHPSVR